MLVWKEQNKLVKKTAAAFCIIVAVVFLFNFPNLVYAQGDTFGLGQVGEQISLGGEDIRVTIAKIIRAVLGLLGVIALSLVIYGGFTIMTAGGSEEKVATGKKILINSAIGLAIILSSFAIVQFVLTALQRATTGQGEITGTAVNPRIQIFAGSGALGRSLRDHYPFRDQKDVRRNTKISVTFGEAADPSSLIIDSNSSGVFGDCMTPQGETFDWNTQCDRLNTEVVKIYPSENTSSLVEAAALASVESNGVFSFTFKPLDFLGNSGTETLYTVDLTSQILKADGETSIFVADRDGHYTWQFEVGTLLDFDPPTITRVYPVQDDEIARNSIIQIDFSEAMDPTLIQGFIGPDFNNVIFGNSNVSGEWRLVNDYKTLEFVSSAACGQNSCGDIMYCLPVECPADNLSCVNDYRVLVRTAELLAAGSFEAVPFTGVADMSGNALDGNADSIPNNKPAIGNLSTIDSGEENPDNYLWSFGVKNEIDRRAPYIEKVLPGIDQENVKGIDPVVINFSMPMWFSSLRQVNLVEYPANTDGLTDMWFIGSAENNLDNNGFLKTVLTIRHREFGPNGMSLYYFPNLPSDVKSINQNCLYPGRGPISDSKNTSPTCSYQELPDGTVIESNCAPVEIKSDKDTACVQTENLSQAAQQNIADCVSYLEEISQTE